MMLITITMVVLSRYWSTVMAWLYSYPCIRALYPVDEQDKERPWDVFICYTEQDAPFVETFLVPGLVRPKNSNDPSYQVCTPAISWDPGCFIVDQIRDSFARSKRFIFVLSKEFLEDKQMEMQFKLAMAQSLKDKTRVIQITN